MLDNEALGQIAAGRPSRPLLVALEAAAATTGRIVLPTSVIVERRHDPTAPVAAEASRILRIARDDALTRARAAEAVRLRARSGEGASVVDAHVAAAALAAISHYGGTATVLTSDIGGLRRLIDATDNAVAKASASLQAL
ncbi:MAG: hypothetical protein ACRD0K_30610 [Egibacteraceae bacterium]